jgi:hypothetical protein
MFVAMQLVGGGLGYLVIKALYPNAGVVAAEIAEASGRDAG